MKKVISISMVIAILFAFTACSSKEYVDIPVTDKDGQAVTDENGEAVTERVLKADTTASSKDESSTAAASSGKSTSAGNQENNNKNNNESTSKGSNPTTAKAGNKNTTTKKTTTKKQTTTKPTTTEKPVKRDIKVTVYIPVLDGTMNTENETKTELTVYYRAEGKKDWKKFKSKDVTLEYANEDKLQKTEEFTITNATGVYEIKADFKGVENIRNNTQKTTVNGEECVIKPIIGIENIVPAPGDGWI